MGQRQFQHIPGGDQGIWETTNSFSFTLARMPYYVLCAGSGSEVEGSQFSVPRSQCDHQCGQKHPWKDSVRNKALGIDIVGILGDCGERESLPNKETLDLRPQWEVRTAVSIAGWDGVVPHPVLKWQQPRGRSSSPDREDEECSSLVSVIVINTTMTQKQLVGKKGLFG